MVGLSAFEIKVPKGHYIDGPYNLWFSAVPYESSSSYLGFIGTKSNGEVEKLSMANRELVKKGQFDILVDEVVGGMVIQQPKIDNEFQVVLFDSRNAHGSFKKSSGSVPRISAEVRFGGIVPTKESL